MNQEGIRHVCGFNDCYSLNEDELVICVHTNKSIKTVTLMCNDPYINGCSGTDPWEGAPVQMQLKYELKNEFIYSVTLKPKFKRIQYYFVLSDSKEQCMLFEDGVYDPEIMNKKVIKHFFKFGWMNKNDICSHPKWVEDIVWYQIFPDRFCRVGDKKSVYGKKLKTWSVNTPFGRHDIFGGNLEGVASKLEYLKDLGVNGIYFNPIFCSEENHKYSIDDYTKVDPDFGTNESFAALVEKAHKLGIKVMIDAVFNHSGPNFFAWKDVCEKGKSSKYYDWYFINSDDFNKKGSTEDSRYYSFAFVDNMPKLNTNIEEVMEYFLNICKRWVDEWNIDGIRFDVGNEISHAFIKYLRKNLKKDYPELYLLGEIWLDSSVYLQGDEYDSVMNYPFLQSVSNFFLDETLNANDFRFKMNYCYSMYQRQINKALFNLIDSHDVDRAISRVGSYDKFIQMLSILMTLPGSPCIYYGTEIGLDGNNDPANRKVMPWESIAKHEYDDTLSLCKQLIGLRRKYSRLLNNDNVEFEPSDSRVVTYTVNGKDTLKVTINAQSDEINCKTNGDILFSYKYHDGVLKNGGVIIQKLA